MAGSLGGNAVQTQQGNLYSGNNMAAMGQSAPTSDPLALPGGGQDYWAGHNANPRPLGTPATPGAPGPGVVPNPGAQGPTLGNQNTGAFDTTTKIDGSQAYTDKVTQAFYDQQKSMLDPQWQQTQANQETQLANMGLSRGTEAWNREADNMNRQKTLAYDTAQRGAILAGGQEATRQEQQQIAAQKAFNDAQSAQQAAAQGWEQFSTSRHNANTAAQASMHGADVSAGASRYATDNASQLGNRGYDLSERGQDFSEAQALERDPYELQNLQMGGQYPTGPTNYGAIPTGAGATMNGANYAAQINQGNATANAGIGSALVAGGRALGGYYMNNVAPGSPGSYDPNYNGAGAPRGDG
jgi:hypothetical protein